MLDPCQFDALKIESLQTHKAYNDHNRALNSSAVSPCNLIGLSSLSPSAATVTLESDLA